MVVRIVIQGSKISSFPPRAAEGLPTQKEDRHAGGGGLTVFTRSRKTNDKDCQIGPRPAELTGWVIEKQ